MPLTIPAVQAALTFEILFADDELAWELHPDGVWRKIETVQGLNAHKRLQSLAIERTR